MSFPFRYRFHPPPHSHWSSWIVRACHYDRKAVWEFCKCLALIDFKSGLPKLHKDVWNVIVGHVFHDATVKHDHGVWKGDYILWLEDWLRDPTQQEAVPLMLDRFEKDAPVFEGEPERHGGVEQFHLWELAFNPTKPNMTTFLYNCTLNGGVTDLPVSSYGGDALIGVQIKGPISAVIKCRASTYDEFGYDFVFEPQYLAHCVYRLGVKEFFYFSPVAFIIRGARTTVSNARLVPSGSVSLIFQKEVALALGFLLALAAKKWLNQQVCFDFIGNLIHCHAHLGQQKGKGHHFIDTAVLARNVWVAIRAKSHIWVVTVSDNGHITRATKVSRAPFTASRKVTTVWKDGSTLGTLFPIDAHVK